MMDVIIGEARHLNELQCREVLNMVKSQAHTLKEGNDGTRINLDKLPTNLIHDIYEYIKRKLGI